MKKIQVLRSDHRRRGATAALVVVSVTTLLAFAALAVDVGIIYNNRTELQRTADAAAHAGTVRLLDEGRLKGGAYMEQVMDDARDYVSEYSAKNYVGKSSISVLDGDVKVGYLSDPFDGAEAMDFSDPSRANAISVRLRQDGQVNGPVSLTFSWIFGKESTTASASATAALMDGIDGFRVTDETGNAGILPMALRYQAWLDLLAGTLSNGDNYSYDPDTGNVSSGSDNIQELNVYPGGSPPAFLITPGNFGKVNIGAPNNSVADFRRQIREGISAQDLSYHGGELSFGDDGTLELGGEPGLSAAVQSDLQAIIGQTRALPLFTTVTGQGNNTTYTIVGLRGCGFWMRI
jgi:hypothetical protein